MAVTTKKTFPATSNATTTVFSPVGIQLNNQDDLDVYVTLSGGTRVLQLRQATASTAVGSGVNKHPQVNDTTGLYFPAVTAGTNLINYTLSTDNNTITFNSALPQGAVVFCDRRTRDEDGTYTSFASGSTIRATDLNNSATESNFTAQDGRNKALTIEGVLFRGDQPSTNFVTTDHIVNDSVTADKIPDDTINSEHYVAGSIDLEHMSANSVDSDQYVDGSIDEVHLSNSAITSNKIANNAVTTTEILNGAVTEAKIATDAITNSKIANLAVSGAEIANTTIDTIKLVDSAVTTDKIADNNVTTNKILNNAVTTAKIADNNVTRAKLVNDAVNEDKLADLAVRTEHIADNAVTAAKIADAVIVTSSEQASHTVSNNTFFTTAAAEARYFNASTGETIKDGQAFPDNDTTIATTAAINDRIIDLVDDVGGFVPIANETSFPTANPDVNNGSGTLVSIKSISSTRTPSSGTVTIANGAGTGNTVSITGCGSTVLTAGFGVIVETTSTLHTYAFHRLVPKATEVTTVAGISSNVTTVATNIADINTVAADLNESTSEIDTVATNIANVNTVGNAIANVNTTAGSIANVNTTAGSITNVNNVGNNISNVNSVAGNASNINSAVSNASNINSAVSNASNINTVAGSISNVNTTAGSISNVNTVASNISNVNNFFNVYRIGANNPTSSLDTGDLFFNTTSNSLKVYTGSAWVDGVTATGSFAVVTGNTFTGSNNHNDNVKSIYGTGSDLEIYHDGSDSYIAEQGTGRLFVKSNLFTVRDAGGSENMILASENSFVKLSYDNAVKLETRSNGVFINGDLDLDDSDKVRIGTGNDLQIFHGGTDSHIENSTGQLKIAGDTIRITNGAVNETQALFTANGAVDLFYNNSLRLSTTANGVTLGHNLFLDNATNAGRDVTWDPANDQLKWNDNTKASFGDSADLQLYHDGNSSFISNTTGDLNLIDQSRIKLRTDQFVVNNHANDESIIYAAADGEVSLYHNGSKKFDTTSTGITVTGILRADEIRMGDSTGGTSPNEKIRLGNSEDLEIYHDGSNSYIADVGTGELRLRGTTIRLTDHNGSENFANFHDNGNVELFYDNAKKFETKSTGVTVSSTANAEITLTSATSGSATLEFGDTDDDSVAQISYNNYNGFMMYRTSDNADMRFFTNNTHRLTLHKTGYLAPAADSTYDLGTSSVRFANAYVDTYYGDGSNLTGINTDLVSDTTPQLGGTLDANGQVISFPDSNGSNNQVRFGTGNDLKLYHQSNSSYILNTTGNLNIASNNEIRLKGGSDAAEMMIKCVDNGRVELYHDSVLNLKTNTNGVYISTDADQGRIRLADTSGNICYQITGQDVASSGESGGRMTIQDALGGVVADMRTSGGNIFLYNTVKLNGNASADNLKLIMGAGEDLQLFHDGSDSFIKDTGIGALKVCSDLFRVNNQANTEAQIKAQENAEVELYYDNSMKVRTTSKGAYINDNFLGVNAAGPSGTPDSRNAFLALGDSDTGMAQNGDGQLEAWANNQEIMNFDTGSVTCYKTFLPSSNNSFDLGTTSNRWRNVYTNDLNLSNQGSSNDVDGTWGDWTIQEGESDLFLKNNRSGKKFKFNLTEVS